MKWPSYQPRKGRIEALLVVFLAATGAIFWAFPGKAETLVQSFKSGTSLEPGWVVAISEKDENTVEPAPASDSSRMYGVVIDPSQVPFTLQRDEGQKVFVATTGTYPVFVNTEHGPINPGDFVSMSLTNGIAAKAVSRQTYVLGKAVEKFDGENKIITKDQNGRAIGRIAVTIIPGRNPLVQGDVAVPSVLKRIGEGVAGKDIAAIRIYTALAIFLLTSIVASIVLWVGVRGGMIAIGRNPLSRRYIIRGLIQVIGIAVLIFIIGVIGVYLLLKL